MTVPWRMDCVFAPLRFDAKHCQKENEGKGGHKTQSKTEGTHKANKGYFGCASDCRYYKGKVRK